MVKLPMNNDDFQRMVTKFRRDIRRREERIAWQSSVLWFAGRNTPECSELARLHVDNEDYQTLMAIALQSTKMFYELLAEYDTLRAGYAQEAS